VIVRKSLIDQNGEAFRFVSSKPSKNEKAKLLWHFCASAKSGEFHSALKILIGARGTLVVRDERLGANIKLQLDIVSFFGIDFERPAEVLADQCAGCASRLDRGVEILIHN
jgi:hypothetical protein